MGATQFYDKAKGADAQEAFTTLRDEALHENGHGGYTGSIAEKSEFTMIPEYTPNDMISAEDFAEKLIGDYDERVDDKWGPAGCIDIGGGEFLFFGWASE